MDGRPSPPGPAARGYVWVYWSKSCWLLITEAEWMQGIRRGKQVRRAIAHRTREALMPARPRTP